VIASIHQPGYLPWHGYFHRLAISDVHIFLDNVQYEKNGFNNRVKVRRGTEDQWLSVPVKTKGRFGANLLCETEIDDTQRWAAKHWSTLQQSYARAPHFGSHASFFDQMYRHRWSSLLELNLRGIGYLIEQLGIGCRLVKASSLGAAGQEADLVLNLCRAVGATTYVSGINGRSYLDKTSFDEAGIELRFQAYHEPQYVQCHGGFRPFMSVVDLLFNHGSDARSILLRDQDTLLTGSSY